jgi:hypothetical protein
VQQAADEYIDAGTALLPASDSHAAHRLSFSDVEDSRSESSVHASAASRVAGVTAGLHRRGCGVVAFACIRDNVATVVHEGTAKRYSNSGWLDDSLVEFHQRLADRGLFLLSVPALPSCACSACRAVCTLRSKRNVHVRSFACVALQVVLVVCVLLHSLLYHDTALEMPLDALRRQVVLEGFVFCTAARGDVRQMKAYTSRWRFRKTLEDTAFFVYPCCFEYVSVLACPGVRGCD